jgi:hypothetical protein
LERIAAALGLLNRAPIEFEQLEAIDPLVRISGKNPIPEIAKLWFNRCGFDPDSVAG